MSGRAITINQAFQGKAQSVGQSNRSQRPAQIFPDMVTTQSQQINPLKSISTVLTQAVTTRDQQSIKQLLVTANAQTIGNTVEQLLPHRLSALLQAIEILLIQDNKNKQHMQVITLWLTKLVKKNIGHIINNPQLQAVCGRISKIIKKRVSALGKLQSLKIKLGRCRAEVKNSKQLVFVPKFHYIEQQNQINHDDEQKVQEVNGKNEQSDLSEIRPEDLEGFDPMAMDLGDQQ